MSRASVTPVGSSVWLATPPQVGRADDPTLFFAVTCGGKPTPTVFRASGRLRRSRLNPGPGGDLGQKEARQGVGLSPRLDRLSLHRGAVHGRGVGRGLPGLQLPAHG